MCLGASSFVAQPGTDADTTSLRAGRSYRQYQELVCLISSTSSRAARRAAQALASDALGVAGAAEGIALAGGIRPLTHLLAATACRQTRDAALCVLSCISYLPACKQALLDAGVCKHALAVLTSSHDSDTQGAAAGLLGNVCMGAPQHAAQLMPAGAIPILGRLLRQGGMCSQMAAYALRVFAQQADLWAASDMASSGIIASCISQLQHSHILEVKKEVALLLYTLLADSSSQLTSSMEHVSCLLLTGGVCHRLVDMASSGDCAANEAAFMLLACLMRSPAGQEAALTAGLAQCILDALTDIEHPACQAAACIALVPLCDHSADPILRVTMAQAGVVELLLGLLSERFSSWQALKAPAARVLGGLASAPPNRSLMIAAGAVSMLLRMMECDCERARESAIFALGQLALADEGPVALVHAGAVPVLQRIVFSREGGWEYMFPRAMKLLQDVGAPFVSPAVGQSVVMLVGRLRTMVG